MSVSDGARVDAQNVLDVSLRSRRCIEYVSPIVGGAPSSFAHNATNNANNSRAKDIKKTSKQFPHTVAIKDTRM